MATRHRRTRAAAKRDTSPTLVVNRSPKQEHLGAGLGAIAGGAAGAIAGPIGIAVGASLGSVIGEATGRVIHERELGAELADASATLRADHDELERLATRVVREISEGDRDDVTAAITEMQSRVLAHLEDEERDLLPTYAEREPEDAALLREEHAAIRKALAEFDLETDLHLVRAEAVAAFLATLKAHAARENAGLYRWAASGTRH